ncbi:hypothetical protein [Komagataeibacter europaeus]|uniref:hypothetical protein n=1 Tax=Komagataeibacter europaeus TaxID=33995 RepID=UPI0002FFF7B8|nr:hypothetical protein [Komagataeibacter europaeus]
MVVRIDLGTSVLKVVLVNGGGSPAGDGRWHQYRPVRPAARGGLAERARECAAFEHRFPRSRQVYGTIAMPGF